MALKHTGTTNSLEGPPAQTRVVILLLGLSLYGSGMWLVTRGVLSGYRRLPTWSGLVLVFIAIVAPPLVLLVLWRSIRAGCLFALVSCMLTIVLVLQWLALGHVHVRPIRQEGHNPSSWGTLHIDSAVQVDVPLAKSP